MNKNDLKEIVKECLIEILLEGVGGGDSNVNEGNTPRVKAQSQPPMRRPALDMIRPKGPAPRPISPVVRAKQNPAAYKELVGGNDVMANIFAETAASGLVESLSSNSSHSQNPIIDTGVDPSGFEGAENWAALAFSESPAKRNRI